MSEPRVPPGYKHVVIKGKTGKVYATGIDTKGRKQTIYNSWFIEKQRKARFQKILRLKSTFERLRTDIDKTLAKKTEWLFKDSHVQELQICLILKLMILCNFRIGSHAYLRKYKTHGLTTLQWKHVLFKKGKQFEIKFIGKKGVLNQAICDDERMYRLLRRMAKAGEDDDFVFNVKACHVNDYIKKYDPQLTAKDIRTWQANVLYIQYYEQAEPGWSEQKKQSYALKNVATFLHNTPAVCKKSYVNPKLLLSG